MVDYHVGLKVKLRGIESDIFGFAHCGLKLLLDLVLKEMSDRMGK